MARRKGDVLSNQQQTESTFDEIVKMVVPSHEKNQVLLIESTFKEPKEKLQGTFWLILTHGAVNEIQKACKEMLNNI